MRWTIRIMKKVMVISFVFGFMLAMIIIKSKIVEVEVIKEVPKEIIKIETVYKDSPETLSTIKNEIALSDVSIRGFVLCTGMLLGEKEKSSTNYDILTNYFVNIRQKIESREQKVN